MKPTDWLVIAVTVAGVVAFMAGLFWAIAHLGGWAALAREYPAHEPAPDADRGFGSLTIGRWCNYNNCIRWRADDDYLHLSLLAPFSSFHAPVSIPWVDATLTRRFFGRCTLKAGRYSLTVPARMVARELHTRALLAGQPSPIA
jgi:hypothetical protein